MSNNRNKLPSRFVRKLGSPREAQQKGKKIRFLPELYDNASNIQKDLLKYFERKLATHPEKKGIYNRDFKYGTLRITEPGYYILKEDIVFNPMNLFPKEDQLDKYPVGKEGPYHLGFFAAITIECVDVILDLNGCSIKQSNRHNLLQRFFACVELANSPFIPNQGPHDFIHAYKPAKNCLIANGKLIESSHHGIHGNTNTNVILQNLVIENYEVAGIALNGAKNTIITECQLIGKNSNIPVLSNFSQAFFSSRALVQCNKTDNAIYKKLDSDIQKAFREIMMREPQTTYFENKTGMYDGNMYGIVLNVNGVVIHDFLKSRDGTQGNEEILLFNNSIDNVETHPVEMVAIGLPDDQQTNKQTAYGGKRMVGAFGDVFDIERVLDSEKRYQGNSLSDAQLFLSELLPKKGTANIAPKIVNWAKEQTVLPDDVRFVPEGDSMGHFMKGNIGLFISGGYAVNIVNMVVKKVEVHGVDVGNSNLLDAHYYQGANAYGVLMTACNDVKLSEVVVETVVSHHPKGIAKKIETL